LVVNDDTSVARVLTHLLRRAGHVPSVAATGAEALRQARAYPDLVLLDLGLPDLPGAEVLRHLKRQPETAEIPVVVVSGDSDAAARVATSGAHAVAAILRLPVFFAELCTVVTAVLRAPAGWAAPTGPPAQAQRAQLIYRLITEGSNALVRQVYVRLDTDRTFGAGAPAAHTSSWPDLARVARQEGLLSEAEGTLLAVGVRAGSG
jgi:DNA-binding response OmpR family regulator